MHCYGVGACYVGSCKESTFRDKKNMEYKGIIHVFGPMWVWVWLADYGLCVSDDSFLFSLHFLGNIVDLFESHNIGTGTLLSE